MRSRHLLVWGNDYFIVGNYVSCELLTFSCRIFPKFDNCDDYLLPLLSFGFF